MGNTYKSFLEEKNIQNNENNTNPDVNNNKNNLSDIYQSLSSNNLFTGIEYLLNFINMDKSCEDVSFDDLKEIIKTLEINLKKLEDENNKLKEENESLKKDKNSLFIRNKILEDQLYLLNKKNMNMNINIYKGICNNIGNINQNIPLQNNYNRIQDINNKNNLNCINNNNNINNNINSNNNIKFSLPSGEIVLIPINNSIKLKDIFKKLIDCIGDKYDVNKINLLYKAKVITDDFKSDKTIENLKIDPNNAITVTTN